jgi:hypothetical protein
LNDGIDCFEEALNKRKDQTVSTLLLITILSLVLSLNIFKFEVVLFQQLIGTAMGMKVAPTFGNIFMAVMEKSY